MKSLLILLMCFISFVSLAQPDTEIYVFDLLEKNGKYEISNPLNITDQNPGYDNQPSFRDDGMLLYVSTRAGQTDVVEADPVKASKKWLTNTTEIGEYSPKTMPNNTSFSAIAGAGGPRKYVDSTLGTAFLPGMTVGYYAWINEDEVVVFSFDPEDSIPDIKMRVCDVKNNTNKIVGENIGRSLDKIPGKNLISFIDKEGENWTISSLDPVSGEKKKITNTIEGSEDLSWSRDGIIFMGSDSKLFAYNPNKKQSWVEVNTKPVKNKEILKGITRLAVSPDGKKIAIVVEQ